MQVKAKKKLLVDMELSVRNNTKTYLILTLISSWK